MVIRCVAIDDEPLALELMRNYINRHPALQLVQAFEDAITAAEFLRKTVVDLVFIDIQMPDISGLDLIRSLETKPLFVLTTAHKNYGFDGYELDVTDYLLKPIAYNRFSRSVQKAEELLASRPPIGQHAAQPRSRGRRAARGRGSATRPAGRPPCRGW